MPFLFEEDNTKEQFMVSDTQETSVRSVKLFLAGAGMMVVVWMITEFLTLGFRSSGILRWVCLSTTFFLIVGFIRIVTPFIAFLGKLDESTTLKIGEIVAATIVTVASMICSIAIVFWLMSYIVIYLPSLVMVSLLALSWLVSSLTVKLLEAHVIWYEQTFGTRTLSFLIEYDP